MPLLWSLRALVLRGAALLLALSLGLGPTPLAAASGEHCAPHHRHTAHHAGAASDGGAGDFVSGGAPSDCPHCTSVQCPLLAPCAGGSTAVSAGRMPQVAGPASVRTVCAGTVTRVRSLSLAPPTPPPLATP